MDLCGFHSNWVLASVISLFFVVMMFFDYSLPFLFLGLAFVGFPFFLAVDEVDDNQLCSMYTDDPVRASCLLDNEICVFKVCALRQTVAS